MKTPKKFLNKLFVRTWSLECFSSDFLFHASEKKLVQMQKGKERRRLSKVPKILLFNFLFNSIIRLS